MDIALSVIYGNHEYYCVFPSNKTITAGTGVADDIQIPDCPVTFMRYSETYLERPKKLR